MFGGSFSQRTRWSPGGYILDSSDSSTKCQSSASKKNSAPQPKISLGRIGRWSTPIAPGNAVGKRGWETRLLGDEAAFQDRVLHTAAQLQNCFRVDLAHTTFGDTENHTDLREREAFVVVERQY